MILRDASGAPLHDDCPCPRPLKGGCLDCPYRAVPWCERCAKKVATDFDREECPPPCGMMHDRCRECGTPLEDCDNEETK